jgi:hypothetical protein
VAVYHQIPPSPVSSYLGVHIKIPVASPMGNGYPLMMGMGIVLFLPSFMGMAGMGIRGDRGGDGGVIPIPVATLSSHQVTCKTSSLSCVTNSAEWLSSTRFQNKYNKIK